MPYYHMYLVANPSLDRVGLVQLLQQSCGAIVERGGVVRQCENLGVRHLAYIMKRHQMVASVGRYIRLHVDCGHSTLQQLQHSMRNNEGILRWSFLRQEEGLTAARKKLQGWQRSALCKAQKIGRKLSLGTDGLSPREAHMVSSNVSSRSSLMSGLADHVEFWRRALDNLKAAGALTPALEKSISRFVGTGATVSERLTNAAAAHMRLAVRDANGEVVAVPWWNREARRLHRSMMGLIYQSKTRRPHQVAFSNESYDLLADLLAGDELLAAHTVTLIDTLSSVTPAVTTTSESTSITNNTATEIPVVNAALTADLLEAVFAGRISISEFVIRIENEVVPTEPRAAAVALASALEGLNGRITARKAEKEARQLENQRATAVMEASLLHHLQHTHDTFQNVATDMTQGPMPKFKPSI